MPMLTHTGEFDCVHARRGQKTMSGVFFYGSHTYLSDFGDSFV